MNDEECRLWVLNDEGLYSWWKSERKPLQTFIREHREELTECIDKALGRSPEIDLRYRQERNFRHREGISVRPLF